MIGKTLHQVSARTVFVEVTSYDLSCKGGVLGKTFRVEGGVGPYRDHKNIQI